jgi:transcriptional regulator with XRE-family HTH domain
MLITSSKLGRVKRRVARFVDHHVGSRIRDRRRSLGVSRGQLAAALDISAEQLRRYEAGAAVIVASRLHQIGRALGVPASYFFEAMPDEVGVGKPHDAKAPDRGSPNARELSRMLDAYRQVSDPELRQHLFLLADALAPSVGRKVGPPTAAR